MKKTAFFLTIALIASLIVGCAGTPVVYYSNCTCPTGSHDAVNTPVPTQAPATEQTTPAEGELKTGLCIAADISGSADAAADAEGQAKFELTMVAVTVDAGGVIQDCVIDGINTSVKFDTTGVFTTDLTAAPQTKNELGENYGMVAYGGAVAEWDEQAAALARFAVGKTVEELKNGAVDETGYAPEGTDLASSATIYLGGYVSAIEQAAANAQNLGAASGDQLRFAVTTTIDSSKAASAEEDGTAQLDVNVTALTVRGDTITSCVIDAVQAKVNFNAAGAITSDITAAPQTKNELGENYGMVAWGGAMHEWNEQAASFASYVTGKTLSEVMGIAVDESTHPTDADLASSVTIAIGGFQGLIAKALQ